VRGSLAPSKLGSTPPSLSGHIAADAELNATFSHTGMTRGPGGRFVPSPDFKSKTTGASFDVTTNSGRAAHEKRYTERGERQPTYLLYDVVEGLDF
jgi:hypothetical protein